MLSSFLINVFVQYSILSSSLFLLLVFIFYHFNMLLYCNWCALVSKPVSVLLTVIQQITFFVLFTQPTFRQKKMFHVQNCHKNTEYS